MRNAAQHLLGRRVLEQDSTLRRRLYVPLSDCACDRRGSLPELRLHIGQARLLRVASVSVAFFDLDLVVGVALVVAGISARFGDLAIGLGVGHCCDQVGLGLLDADIARVTGQAAAFRFLDVVVGLGDCLRPSVVASIVFL